MAFPALPPVFDIHPIVQGISDVHLASYIAASALTLWVYDLLLNLDLEVEFVWTKPWRLGQILYLCNRYISGTLLALGVAWQIRPLQTLTFCRFWPVWVTCSALVILILVQWVLMIRVCAIYHHSRTIRYVVLGGAVVEVAAVLALGLRILLSAQWTPVVIAGVHSCAPGGAFPSWRWVFWITPLTYYCILFVLVVRGAHWTRGHSKDWKASSSRALRLIVRDSTINFVYNLAIQTAYIFIWRFGRTGLMQVPTFIAFSLESVQPPYSQGSRLTYSSIIFATKLLLNLWERFYRDEAHDGTPSPTFALNTYSLVRKPLRDDDNDINLAAQRAVHVEESFWGIKDSDEDNGAGRVPERDGLDVLRRLMTG